MSAFCSIRRLVSVVFLAFVLSLLVVRPSFIVQAQTVRLYPATLANGTVGVPYSQTIVVPGNPPFEFHTPVGYYPPGLMLYSNGVIRGVPTHVGTFEFTIEAASTQYRVSQQYQITVAPSTTTTLSILPENLPFGVGNLPYHQGISATGGTPPYTFEILDGQVNPGISFNATSGIFSGSTNTPAGFGTFTMRVTDSAGNVGLHTYYLAIPLTRWFSVTSFYPGGTLGTAYAGSMFPTGGSLPYSFTLAKGSLPPGLTFDPATGAISGTPTAVGPHMFTVAARDGDGHTQYHNAAIEIQTSAHTLRMSMSPCRNVLGRFGVGFVIQALASGGTPPYRFSVLGNSLPAGLAIDVNTGTISGTPTVLGEFYPHILVTDNAGNTASLNMRLSIRPNTSPMFQITPAVLPDAQVGSGYSVQLMIDGAWLADNYLDNTGRLPPGLSLNWQTGVLSGTPVVPGDYSFEISAYSFVGASYRTMNLRVLPAPNSLYLQVEGASTFSGSGYPTLFPQVTVPFNGQMQAGGGTPPYTYRVVGGALPSGLMLSSAGLISGIPSQASDYFARIEATDSTGRIGTRDLYFTVASSAVSPPQELPAATMWMPYNQLALPAFGTTPYSYTVIDGALPAGLTLDPATGNISGTTTQSGRYPFSVYVTDANRSTVIRNFVLPTVNLPALLVTTPTLPNGTVGSAYSQTINATGGVPPYALSLLQGAVPPGLILASNGVISGVPQQPGFYNFTVQVNDASRTAITHTYAMQITAASAPPQTLMLTPSDLPVANVGMAYQAVVGAQGGTPPYNYLLVGGTLPPGFGMDGVTGVISGIASAVGSYPITVQALDSAGNSGTGTFNLVVAPSDALGGH